MCNLLNWATALSSFVYLYVVKHTSAPKLDAPPSPVSGSSRSGGLYFYQWRVVQPGHCCFRGRGRFWVQLAPPYGTAGDSVFSRACNGINGTGQDRIILVERRNGKRQDISQGLKRRTGQDRICLLKKLTGQDRINPVTSRYLTGYPVRNLAGHPVKNPGRSYTNLLIYNCFDPKLYEGHPLLPTFGFMIFCSLLRFVNSSKNIFNCRVCISK